MKTFKLAIVFALLMALAVVAGASAQGPSSYTSGFQVQNLDDTNAAAINITYYNKNGTVNATTDDSVPAGDSNTYFGANVDASDGFDGSVVISSDQPVAAIVNLLGDGGTFGGASYDSFSAGSANANIPLVLNDFFGISTFFNVQNTGSSPVDVDVEYIGTGGCSETTVTIQPGAAATFDQTASCLGADFIGAASVTSNGTVAVAVVQYDSQSLLAFNAFTSDGSGTAVAPLVSHNYFSSRTAIQVQNTSDSATDVTINYSPSAGFPGSACSETKNVAAGGSENFGDNTFFLGVGDPCNAAAEGWVGAAEIVADSGTVVAIVNSVTSGTANAAAYAAFDPTTATTSVSFPLIMDRNFGIFTGFSVANVSAGPIDVNCTFSGTTYTAEATGLASGASLTDVQFNNIADGYVGSATCTGDAGIVGVVSQLGGSGDALLYYEGFNN